MRMLVAARQAGFRLPTFSTEQLRNPENEDSYSGSRPKVLGENAPGSNWGRGNSIDPDGRVDERNGEIYQRLRENTPDV